MRRGLEAFRNILVHDPMQVVLPLVIFAVTFGAGWLVRRAVLRGLKAWNARTESRAGRILQEGLRGPLMIWSLMLAAHFAMESSQIPVRYTVLGADILLGLWILSLTIMCMRVVGDIVRYYGAQIPGALPVTTLTQTLAQVAVQILGALILLNHFKVSITPILTAFGVGGLAVALALQDTLSNLFAGFYVSVAGQVRLGDYIKLNTGEEGYVTDISWRSTTIRALANNMIIIPNAKLAQAVVTNYCLPERRMSLVIPVSVSYDSDPDHIERVLLEEVESAAGTIAGLLAEPAPMVRLIPGFGDSALNFS